MVDLILVGIALVVNFNGGQIGPNFNPDNSIKNNLSCPATQDESRLLEMPGGIKINKYIYLQTNLMLLDAANASQPLKIDNSYRTCQQQVQLRRQNCETIKEDEIFTKNPKSCKITTEIPGQSLHSEGLAVDFACDGSIKFEESSCYTWMKNNASKYGFHEHREEPWHWSLTGD
jgi:LAS superfamily LD-carboxypeptidase LdcB